MKHTKKFLSSLTVLFERLLTVGYYPLDSENIKVYQHGKVKETKAVVYRACSNNSKQDNLFVFKYMLIDGRWRAYVIRMPNHAERQWDNHITHLDPDWGKHCNGTLHVDWDSPVKALDDMQKIAHRWADLCLRYIETGKWFDSQ